MNIPRHQPFPFFLIGSTVLHGLLIAAALLLVKPDPTPLPATTPVRIVELPREQASRLPPLGRPELPRQTTEQRPSTPQPARTQPERPFTPPMPERRIAPQDVPMPKQFGDSNDMNFPDKPASSPKTGGQVGRPDGSERGKENGQATVQKQQKRSRLPFVTQNVIDELAKKGMPAPKPGDDSITLDTDEFKYISYNRWLKVKIESVLHYPELAAISGYQGAIYIQFDIKKDGSLGDVEVLQSSGYKILDDEAVRSIRSSAPFQALPDAWGMDHYAIRAAVVFYMNEGYLR